MSCFATRESGCQGPRWSVGDPAEGGGSLSNSLNFLVVGDSNIVDAVLLKNFLKPLEELLLEPLQVLFSKIVLLNELVKLLSNDFLNCSLLFVGG